MRTRILTALAGIPAMLLLLFWPGGIPWAVGIAVLTGMALYEYTVGLKRKDIWVHWGGAGLYAAAILVNATSMGYLRGVAWHPSVDGAARFLLVWAPGAGQVGPALAFAALLVGDLLWPHRAPLKNVGATLLGIAYIPLLFSFLVLLRGVGSKVPWWSVDPGAWAVLCVLLVIWAGDSAAYFVGRAFGTRKCAPAISPNKTWEGVLGGLAASALAGALALWPLFGWTGQAIGIATAVAYGLLFGLFVGAAGQVGDLVESAIKREVGIKDFGGLLPGHGGILDRFDSLLFAAPAAWVLLSVLMR